MRHAGHKHEGMSASFLSCNRSKRSLSVDIKSPKGLEIVKKLVETADVLVQNYRPGAIERMGLGEDAVRGIKPDIIFVSISGFGEHGPYANQRVYDPVIQALCGLADIQTDRVTGEPRMVRTIIPDKTTSVTAAQAITAALLVRERTGEGQHVRLAMLDTMVAYLWPEGSSGMSFIDNEIDPARGQMGLDLVFKTTDGYITAGAVSDAEWQGMCRALNREDMLEDPRFVDPAIRSKHTVERRQFMSDEIAKWSAAELLLRFLANEVPCAPILDRRAVIENEQVVQNKIFEIHDHPVLGKVRQPRPAARFDRTPAEVKAMAPFLGADNAAILSELGYTEDEIGAFGKDGVVKTAAG